MGRHVIPIGFSQMINKQKCDIVRLIVISYMEKVVCLGLIRQDLLVLKAASCGVTVTR